MINYICNDLITWASDDPKHPEDRIVINVNLIAYVLPMKDTKENDVSRVFMRMGDHIDIPISVEEFVTHLKGAFHVKWNDLVYETSIPKDLKDA